MNYNFKTYAPFTMRGDRFPKNIVRTNRTSLVISSNIMEGFGAVRYTNDNGQERVPIIFEVDTDNNVLKLTPSMKGYVVQCRQNGNGYLNTSRIHHGLPVGDYLLDVAEGVFRLK